jgi:hypothetical protein
LLLEFLVTAGNASASGRSRVQYFESDSPAFKAGNLPVERQLTTLRQGRIAYVTFDGKSHVIFVTSDEETFTLQTPFAKQVVDWVLQFLPEIDRLLSGADWGRWLHLQLRTRGSISYVQGCNLYVRAGMEAPAENVVHLLAMTYFTFGPTQSLPIFIVGGFADVIADYLTGRTVRAGFVTGGKVSLAFRAPATSLEYNREAANGYSLFKSLLSIAGPEAFFGALSLMVEHELGFGIGVLRLLKSKISDKEAVEALFIERIADYVPGSA